MSLDYPDYQRLKKKHLCLGVMWQIGDLLYYISLILAVIMPLGIVGYHFCMDPSRRPSWEQVILAATLSFGVLAIAFIAAGEIKSLAFRLGGGARKYYEEEHSESKCDKS